MLSGSPVHDILVSHCGSELFLAGLKSGLNSAAYLVLNYLLPMLTGPCVVNSDIFCTKARVVSGVVAN